MRLAEFNKYNGTGARMLDFIYHMTLKLLKNMPSLTQRYKRCHYVVSTNLLHDVISLPDATSCDKFL